MPQALTFAIPNKSVATAAALTALTGLSALSEGALAHVSSYDTQFELVTTGIALEANVILASSDANRRWIRKTTSTPKWAMLYAPNVFVDASAAGNDENDGLTAGTALKTTDEVARRVPTLIQPITINVVGSTALSTPLSWSPNIQWDKSISASLLSICLLYTSPSPRDS